MYNKYEVKERGNKNEYGRYNNKYFNSSYRNNNNISNNDRNNTFGRLVGILGRTTHNIIFSNYIANIGNINKTRD